ncbi:MAG: hypothetical protein AB1Z18_07245, partial [Desulfobacterales bacterium]
RELQLTNVLDDIFSARLAEVMGATVCEVLAWDRAAQTVRVQPVVLRQEIYKKGNGELVADADVTFVIADAKTRKPLNLKDLLKDAMVS